MAAMNLPSARRSSDGWVSIAAYENVKGRPHPAAAVRA